MGNFDGTPMQGVSGVSGAAPVLHELFEHLHARFGTSWFPTPTNIVECLVHPITGRRMARPGHEGIAEKFVDGVLPPIEAPDDYDVTGRVRLPASYRAWVGGGDNLLGDAVVLDSDNRTGESRLKLVSPQPGTVFLLDPDLPPSSHSIPLKAEGGLVLRWESDSLECRVTSRGPVAFMREGRHRLRVISEASGQQAETWVIVKAL
jgi:penicillin-binding protein 1C